MLIIDKTKSKLKGTLPPAYNDFILDNFGYFLVNFYHNQQL